MATEDDGTEAGGQDDGGDVDDGTEDETPVDTGEPERAAKDDGEKPKSPRTQRRVHHMRAASLAMEAAARERDEYRRRLEETENRTRELQSRWEQQQQQTQVQSSKAQTQERVTQLRRQARQALALSAQTKGKEAEDHWNEYERLNDEAADLRNEMADNERWQKRQGEIQQSLPNQEMMQERQYISAKYPWVETNVEGRSLADGRFTALVKAGRPASRATMEEALTYAAKMLRLGGQSAPTEASRQRYAGFAQRDGEQDDGASSGSMSAEEVQNSLPLKRLAELTYPQLEARQAYAKYAREIGSKAKRTDA